VQNQYAHSVGRSDDWLIGIEDQAAFLRP